MKETDKAGNINNTKLETILNYKIRTNSSSW